MWLELGILLYTFFVVLCWKRCGTKQNNMIRPWIHFERASVLPGIDPNLVYGVQVGINYTLCPARYRLQGCVNDALNFQTLLSSQEVPASHLVLLTDFTQMKPTKTNILKSLRTTFDEAGSQIARVLFTFSGHGTRQGQQETFCALDQNLTGVDYITDIELGKWIGEAMKDKPPGVTLTVVADSCYSENMMDLPYTYVPNAQNTAVFQKNTVSLSFPQMAASVILISGSTKFQTSAEVEMRHKISHGALTWTILRWLSLHRLRPFTYREFLLGINRQLKAQDFSQVSCLSSNVPLQLDSQMRFP